MTYRVVVVEDHPAIRSVYRHLIDRVPSLDICGEVATGAEAFGLIAQTNADLLLLDIGLPDINGIQLLKQLKQQYPHLPVIVISGEDEFVYAPAAMRAGASRYIDKVHVTELW
ncbi:MAG: response regulator transcription factor [Caldilineaceae bacterium]